MRYRQQEMLNTGSPVFSQTINTVRGMAEAADGVPLIAAWSDYI